MSRQRPFTWRGKSASSYPSPAIPPKLHPARLAAGGRCSARPQTAGRGFGGSVFLRRVGSDQGPKNFEKALNGAARTEGLRGDASAFAQEEQFVGEQLGIA